MDRSSFHFVDSTFDVEKRKAFKAKLAGKIEPLEVIQPVAVDLSFNGVQPGGKLVHPSLGEGVLVEVNHGNNEVVIDFASEGLISLVLSQAKAFVHAPVRNIVEGVAGKDDPFSGGEIQSRVWVPKGTAFRDVDLSRVVSPDFVDPKVSFISEGSLVWHPDLGACTVFSVDEGANLLTLDTSLNGRVDLVLSQVRSSVREISSAPEHVPVKPLVSEPLARNSSQFVSRGDVSVVLPEVFKSWRKEQQFMFLTRNQHLTTDQANDVLAVLDGSNPLFHGVSVCWQNQEVGEALVSGVSVPSRVKVVPSVLEQKNLWHPDFGACSVSSVNLDANELILLTSRGLVPFVLDVVVSSLAVLPEGSVVEHSPKRFIEAPPSKSSLGAEVPVVRVVSVSLPEEFKSWTASGQYVFLTRTRHLTGHEANDVMDVLSGKPINGSVRYDVVWGGL